MRGGGKSKEGGKRGKNVSAYAIADDLEIRNKRKFSSWSGWMGSQDIANPGHNIMRGMIYDKGPKDKEEGSIKKSI